MRGLARSKEGGLKLLYLAMYDSDDNASLYFSQKTGVAKRRE